MGKLYPLPVSLSTLAQQSPHFFVLHKIKSAYPRHQTKKLFYLTKDVMKYFNATHTKLAIFLIATLITLGTAQNALSLELDLGVQISENSFSVWDDTANQVQGEIIQQRMIYPILGLSSRNRYLGDTYFRWSVEAAYRWFSAKEQWLDATGEAKNLGYQSAFNTFHPSASNCFHFIGLLRTIFALLEAVIQLINRNIYNYPITTTGIG